MPCPFDLGEKALKVKVSFPIEPHDVPLGGPYTVTKVADRNDLILAIWNPEPGHWPMKVDSHPMWDCSCNYRKLPPPESKSVDGSQNIKKPETV